jgi:electron transfer flavoprotein beta subunit
LTPKNNMKIIVCLKLIADPDIIEFDVVKNQLRNLRMVLDPVGHCLLEAGLELRERWGGEVIAVSVAPEAGNAILRRALLYGADRAVRVWQDELREADTWRVSQVLQGALEITGYDLVLCGARSRDTASGFLAAALAGRLNVACANGVAGLETPEGRKLTAHKKLPRGERETFSLELPAVVGLEEGLNEPRYVAPHSRTFREGLKREIEFLSAERLSLRQEPLVRVLCYTQSRPRVKTGINIAALSTADKLKMMRGELGRRKELFAGDPNEASKKIYTLIKEIRKG